MPKANYSEYKLKANQGKVKAFHKPCGAFLGVITDVSEILHRASYHKCETKSE